MTQDVRETARQLARQAQTAFPGVHLTFLEGNIADALEKAIKLNESFERMCQPQPRQPEDNRRRFGFFS